MAPLTQSNDWDRLNNYGNRGWNLEPPQLDLSDSRWFQKYKYEMNFAPFETRTTKVPNFSDFFNNFDRYYRFNNRKWNSELLKAPNSLLEKTTTRASGSTVDLVTGKKVELGIMKMKPYQRWNYGIIPRTFEITQTTTKVPNTSSTYKIDSTSRKSYFRDADRNRWVFKPRSTSTTNQPKRENIFPAENNSGSGFVLGICAVVAVFAICFILVLYITMRYGNYCNRNRKKISPTTTLGASGSRNGTPTAPAERPGPLPWLVGLPPEMVMIRSPRILNQTGFPIPIPLPLETPLPSYEDVMEIQLPAPKYELCQGWTPAPPEVVI